MSTYLDRILEAHRARAARDDRDVDALVARSALLPPCRGLTAALAAPGLSVIAEIKRRSPSKGSLADAVDPPARARAYAEGGAAALSVLTDATFFGGSPDDLAAARGAVALPVLRKDFTVCAADVCDARLMGADGVLLIVAALDDVELADLHRLAVSLGLDVLVEVHDEREADRALAVGASLVGVNQRDLVTFEVDGERAARVVAHLPDDVVKVAESGVTGGAQARALHAAGYDAVLVGELLMRSPRPAEVIRALRGAETIPGQPSAGR